MIYQKEVVEPPDESAVSLVEAKLHLRVEGTEEDAYIQGLVDGATKEVEETYLWRALVQRSYRLTSLWHGRQSVKEIHLPMAPIQSVSLVESDGVPLTAYTLYGEAGLLVLDAPVTPARELLVEYVAGYGAANTVPALFKQAILLLVAGRYENREAVVLNAPAYELPLGVKNMLLPFRAWRPGER